MNTERVMIMGGRHGVKTLDGNDITSESKARVYAQGENVLVPFVREYGVKQDEMGLRTSPRRRAMITGLVRYAPVFGVVPREKCADVALRTNVFVQPVNDKRLDYTERDFNVNVLREKGIDHVVRYATANPFATEHEGVPINPPVNLLISGASMWTDALREISNGTGLLQLVSHGHTWDQAVAALFNSGREKPVTNPDEYGGSFREEDYVTLRMDRKLKSGTLSNPDFRRNGQRYKVNLSAFGA